MDGQRTGTTWWALGREKPIPGSDPPPGYKAEAGEAHAMLRAGTLTVETTASDGRGDVVLTQLPNGTWAGEGSDGLDWSARCQDVDVIWVDGVLKIGGIWIQDAERHAWSCYLDEVPAPRKPTGR